LSQPGYDDKSDDLGLGKPIVDLFPHTTVLFADIVVLCGIVILSIIKTNSISVTDQKIPVSPILEFGV
jgi:hypothetical protein